MFTDLHFHDESIGGFQHAGTGKNKKGIENLPLLAF